MKVTVKRNDKNTNFLEYNFEVEGYPEDFNILTIPVVIKNCPFMEFNSCNINYLHDIGDPDGMLAIEKGDSNEVMLNNVSDFEKLLSTGNVEDWELSMQYNDWNYIIMGYGSKSYKLLCLNYKHNHEQTGSAFLDIKKLEDYINDYLLM
jgi:hypothetical protein